MKSPTLKGMEDNLFAIEDGYGKRKKKDFDKIPGLVFFYDELILWSVFMTGSKTPGMSDKRDVIDFTVSDPSKFWVINLKV